MDLEQWLIKDKLPLELESLLFLEIQRKAMKKLKK